MREHIAGRPSKCQRGTTPKRPRPSRGKAQAEQSKSRLHATLTQQHPSRQTRYATPQFTTPEYPALTPACSSPERGTRLPWRERSAINQCT
jgi:hypothetical protein